MVILSAPIIFHSSMASSTVNDDDFIIREIMLTHDSDDRCHLDCSLLLSLVEATLSCSSENATGFDQEVDATSIDLFVPEEEPTSRIIYKISHEMLSRCFESENLHRNTMTVLEILGRYRWDAKMVLALASFTHSFSIFWLILQLQSENALAVSLASVKRIPAAINFLQPKFKALNLLVTNMLKLTKLVISYESLSVKHELADDQDRTGMRWRIYLATYWICRSILVCSSKIVDLRNLNLEQVCTDRTVVAAWGLYSLGYKLSSLCSDLAGCIDKCQQQIETRLYSRLLHMFKETEADNQEFLNALFAWQDEFPFKNSSREKIGILELKSKIALLLITRPNLLPLDRAFFLVQQTRISEQGVVLWVPIPSPDEWSPADKMSFEFFSDRVPWLSVRRPWSLNSSVVKFITQEWNFREDPIIVVVNEHGLIANANAMDMVWIWGPKAFPFSSSRERELWQQADWTVDLLINGISPLLSEWVEQGRSLCIYGSDNMDWIRKLNEKIKKMRASGIHLEAVYVGCKNPGENVRSIIHSIDQGGLSSSMTFNGVDFFWYRLEILKRSVGQQDRTSRRDEIAARVGELLEMDSRDGWAVIGRGSFMVELDQERLEQGLEAFHLWYENVTETDIARAHEATRVDGERCRDDEVVAYEEGLIEKTKICGSCKKPMEKFVYYKCDV